MKRLLMVVVIVLVASFAHAQDYSHHKGEKALEWLGRVQQEDRQKRLQESQIQANEAIANRLRQNNKNEYKIHRSGNKFIVEED